MSEGPGILIIDRDAIAAEALRLLLTKQGYAVHHARSCADASTLLQGLRSQPAAHDIGVVLLDQDAAGHGLNEMRRLLTDRPRLVPIMMSAFRKVASAVSAMRLGAADYLLKPIIEAELYDAVQRAQQRHLLMVERDLSQQEVEQPVEHAEQSPGTGWQPMPLSEAMKAPERCILLAALEANGWNRGETAKQLDINRTTLYKKIRQHRLDEPA
ncbi:MAG: response regulator [Planctomycetota bacterium]